MRRFRLISILAVLILVQPVYAGKIERAYTALKVYDYFNAKKLFYKGLKYNQSPAAQGLAIIYYRNDNPFHDLDSALNYVQVSLDSYDLTKAGKQEKYAPLGFTKDSLLQLRALISTAVFDLKRKENSIAAYQSFIDVHIWAKERNRAIELRDSIAFFDAVHQNTSKAFNEFMSTYPQTAFTELAEESYHHLKFVEETGDGSLSSYERFVEKNPGSPLVEDARKEVYRMMTEAGSIEGYEQFIEKHQSYPQLKTAWDELFQKFMNPYTEERINAFNEKYPDHPITDRVNIEKERLHQSFLPFMGDGVVDFVSFDRDTILELNYDAAGNFREGLCSVAKDSKVGVVDVTGKVRVPLIYESISEYRNGQAIVELDEKFGVIDRNGRKVMDLLFDDVGELIEDRRYAQMDELYGYYDDEGHNIIKHQFTDAYDFEAGRAKVLFQEKEAYIEPSGQYVIPPYFDEVKPFNDSLFVYTEDDMMGIATADCKKITEPVYAYIGNEIYGIAVAELDDRVIYMDAKGNIRIDKSFEVFPNYTVLGTFKDSVAVVYQDEKYARIAPDGTLINKFKYENIGNGKASFTAMREGMWGLYAKNDKTILSPVYNELYFVTNDLLVASRNDTTGMIRPSGKVVIPFAFESIEKLTDSLYLVKQNGAYGVYKLGELVFPAIYSDVSFFEAGILKLIREEEFVYYSIEENKSVSSKADVRLD